MPKRQVPSLTGDVVKWLNTEVCKTSIHRFESGRRLHRSAGRGAWASVRFLRSDASHYDATRRDVWTVPSTFDSPTALVGLRASMQT